MRIQALRVEREDGRVTLHTAGGGKIEIDAARLASVEHVEDPTPEPSSIPAQSATAQAPEKSVHDLVTDAALRYGLPPELVHGVAQAESAYQPAAVSPKGAIGIMQLMPDTARKFDADPLNPAQNIDAGTRLLRDLLLRYEGSGNGVRRALAAYNAGESAVERYGGVPPFRETQGYVERVIGLYWKNVRASSLSPAASAVSPGPEASTVDSGSGSGTN
ncbi:MAG: lytic transglycosylase domain-containing protein [Bryobacteraceae bacterium]|nr:lytic transglycosylase domain-containing protein [Bryobacteraceae bacterium]